MRSLTCTCRFDTEFAARLKQKHETTIAYVDEITSYRHNLLVALANNTIAQQSSLTKSYKASMFGVDLTRPPATASKQSSMSAKSSTTTLPKPLSNKELSFSVPSEVISPSKQPKESKDTSIDLEWDLESEKNQIISMRKSQARISAEQIRAQLESQSRRPSVSSPPSQLPRPLNQVPTVLFYCACMASGLGTFYLTHEVISITSGLFYREMLPLNRLTSVSLLINQSSLLASNTIKLLFFEGRKEVSFTPLIADGSRLKLIICDAAAAFGNGCISN